MQPPSASKEQIGGCRSGTAAHDAPSKKPSLPPPQATNTSKSSDEITASLSYFFGNGARTSGSAVSCAGQKREGCCKETESCKTFASAKIPLSVQGLGVLFGQSAFSRSAASSGEKHHSTMLAICGQPSPRTQPADIVCTRTTATARPFELEPLMMEWLDDLGLRQSVKQRFIHEHIDCEHLALMSHDQLEQLGVNKVFAVHFVIVAIMIVHDIPCYDKCKQLGDRLKLLNRAQLHQEHEADVGDGRSRDECGNAVKSRDSATGSARDALEKLFDTWQKSVSRPKSKNTKNEHELQVTKMVKKIPTMQEICSNLGLMPATPPNKTLPASPNQSRWSIAGYSRGDAHSANRKTSARPSSTATPIPRNENPHVSPTDMASESRASWQVVCRAF